MMRRVGWHLRRKGNSCQVEIIRAGLQRGKRCYGSIELLHDGGWRFEWFVEIRDRGEQEVQKGRRTTVSRLQRRCVTAGDKHALTRAECLDLSTDRNLGRARELVDDPVGRRDAATCP